MEKKIQLVIFFLFLTISNLLAQSGLDIREEVEYKTTILIVFVFVAALVIFVVYFLNRKVLPSDLMEKARVANVDISDFGLIKLRAKGDIDIERVLLELIRANIAGIHLTLEDIKDVLFGVGDVTLSVIIDNLIISHKSGLELNIHVLYRHSLINKDISDFVKAKIKIRNGKLGNLITDEILEDHLMSGGDMIAFVDYISKAKKSGVKIDMDELMEANLDKEGMLKILSNLTRSKKAGVYIANDEVEDVSDAFHYNKISQSGLLQIYFDDKDIGKYVEAIIKVHKFGIKDLLLSELFEFALTKEANVQEAVDALIKAKRADLDITLDDIMLYSINHGDVHNFVEAYMISKNAKLNITLDELEKHQLAGGNIINYVKALKIAKIPDIGISKKDIETLSLKGGNVLLCALAIVRANELGVDLNWGTSSMIALGKLNPVDVVLECVNPKVIHVPAFKVVGKDGIVLKIHASIAVMVKMDKFFSGSGEKTLFERVNEGIIHEISHYKDNKSIVNNLNNIAQKAFHHLHEQTEINKQSKFILEDITIPEIEVLEDIYHSLKEEHAKLDALTKTTTAQAELLVAEAKVENAFAEAIKSGKVNDYYKHKIYKKEKKGILDDEKQNDAHGHHGGDAHSHTEHKEAVHDEQDSHSDEKH